MWVGGTGGIKPILSGATLELANEECDPRTIPWLIEALDDDKRDIAAHVVLTVVSGMSFEVDGAHWNGVRVRLSADGSVSARISNRVQNKKDWENRWQNTYRPRHARTWSSWFNAF
jgi:hypothetical protein